MHLHTWKYVCKGTGRFPKANTPQPLQIRGVIERCECDAWRIVPDHPGYQPVALDPYEDQDAEIKNY